VKGSHVTAVEDFNLTTRAPLDERIAARATDFISRSAKAGKPFFTYICFTQLHPPLIPHPVFKGKSAGGVYSDALAELDFRTGQVLDAIDQAGIADNTIVVWNSDNPAGRATSMGGSNGPWRGHFGSDAAVMSVKWKTMKVVFRYSESTSGPIIKPQWPFVYDLIDDPDDPNEEWDLIDKRLDCAWVILPVAKAIGALAQSGSLPTHQAG